jgi:hypothetical protein
MFRMWHLWRAWLALLVMLVIALGCADKEERRAAVSTPSPPPRPEKPALRIVALTDLSGYLEPCGCQSRPLGGLDKAAAQLAALESDGVPTLLVAAGDLLFGEQPKGASSAEQAATQETWKAETLIAILSRMHLAAAAPGAHDLAVGAWAFAGLTKDARLHVMPAAPAAGDAPEAVARWSTKVGNVNVGIVGLSTFAAADSSLDDAREQALQSNAQAEVDALRKAGAEVIVALANTNRRTGRRLAGALRGVDFWLQGGVAEAAVPAPSRVGKSVLLRAGQNGQGLLVLELHRGQGSEWQDVSAWTRREHSAGLRARIADLEARIMQWERDPNTDPVGLAEQRQKLDALNVQLTQAAAPQKIEGKAFDARFIELGPEIEGDANTSALMDTHDARVNDHNKVAFADVTAPKAPPGTAHYVGSDACKSCHRPAFAWWTETKHGHAYATLVTRHKEFNLSCVACHVTGYGKPGGSAVVQNAGLVNVGCESCHGAGSLHVDNPDEEPALGMLRSPTATVCLECHTPEHSDLFEFPAYRARMLAPGHGMPLAMLEPTILEPTKATPAKAEPTGQDK